jgi:murein DD-endopeptidase MepM/ murein hydrolase activator NlpD
VRGRHATKPGRHAARDRRRGLTGLLAVAGTGLVGAALVVITPVAAQAAGVSGQVQTSTLLNVRAAPNATAAVKTKLRGGSRITIACQQPGQKVNGTVRSTALWDRLPNGTFVSDAYIKRGTARLARCVTAAVAPALPALWVAPVIANVGGGFRTAGRPTHDGVDLSTRRNTPIRSVDAGVVIRVVCNASTNNCNVDGSPTTKGCGWYVEVQHADKVVTRYCHMVRRPSVNVGQRVLRGQVIGYVGSSGHSSGPHLHFEVHTNAAPVNRANAVDPVPFLRKKGVFLPVA